MMAVPVQVEPSFSYGDPERLFEFPWFSGPGRVYDIGSDGRFLIAMPVVPPDAERRQINIVRHWTEELKAQVPTE